MRVQRSVRVRLREKLSIVSLKRYGGAARNSLFGRPRHSSLFGVPRHSSLFPRSGHSSLFGIPWHSSLFGRPGRNSLFGGSGQIFRHAYVKHYHIGIVLLTQAFARRATGDALDTIILWNGLLCTDDHSAAMYGLVLARSARSSAD